MLNYHNVNYNRGRLFHERYVRLIIIVIIVLTLVVGCRNAEPTVTPEIETPPPTATQTLIPPTVEPSPTATPTVEPSPTVVIQETVVSRSPVMADISAYVGDLTLQDQFAGAVLVAQQGEFIFKGAYGLADRSLDVPNQVDTKFNLGSMDKMFTAVAILQLVEQGKLSLDDIVADIMPEYADTRIANQASVHQLLTHMSGMGDYLNSEYYKDIRLQIRSVADYLPLFINTSLRFEPGVQFGYSNVGYIVLGLIIEKVSGQSYYDYVRENIFESSGMINTASYELDAGAPNLAIGYTKLDAEGNEMNMLTDNSFMMPMRGGSAGGGFSTVEDLLKFGNALLDHELLSPASTQLLLQGKVELNETIQYAYGLFDQAWNDQRVVSVSGIFPGICSYMGMYLDTGYILIVLSNTDEGCYPVIEFVRDQIFDN